MTSQDRSDRIRRILSICRENSWTIDTPDIAGKLYNILKSRGPNSLRICALLSKPSRREVEVPIEFIGFTIDDLFVVGYGLDFDEQYRNLPDIAVLEDGPGAAATSPPA